MSTLLGLIGLTFLLTGIVLYAIATLNLAVIMVMEDDIWLIISKFPFGSLIFVITHPGYALKPFIMQTGGLVLFIFGGLFLLLSPAFTGTRSRTEHYASNPDYDAPEAPPPKEPPPDQPRPKESRPESKGVSNGARVAKVESSYEAEQQLAPQLYEQLKYSANFQPTLDQLVSLGPRGKPAIPKLAKLFRYSMPATSEYSVRGDLSLPTEARRALVKTFNRLEPTPAEGVSIWAVALTDPEADIRACGEEGLARIDEKDRVPLLLVALGDSDARVRVGAAKALGRLGPQAAAALPRLASLLRDMNEQLYVPQAALEALCAIGPAAHADALAALAWAMEERRTLNLRNAARNALLKMGSAAEPTWITVMTDRAVPSGDRCLAAKMLGRPTVSKEAMSALIGSLDILEKRGESALRKAIILALGECGAPAKNALPLLNRLAARTSGDSAAASEAARRISGAATTQLESPTTDGMPRTEDRK